MRESLFSLASLSGLLQTICLCSATASAFADCPSIKRANLDLIAKNLLRAPVVFTATIVSGRVLDKVRKFDGNDPIFEEDYRVLHVIQGASPSHTSLKVLTPCDSEADCFKSAFEANEYLKERIGRTIIVAAFDWTDEQGQTELVVGTCPSTDDVDLKSSQGQALAAAMKQEVKR